MKINIPNKPARAATPVTFVLKDEGGAHVSITLSIKGFPPIMHDDTYGGSKEAIVHLSPGTYPCTVIIAAFKYGALNARYDSSITANSVVIASATGNVPAAQQSDMEFENFKLVVT